MASDYASKVLGAALLQGWTMSAQECTQQYCAGCPLMVSRDGKDSFCARCDGGGKVGVPRQGLVEPLAASMSATLNSQTRVSSPTSSTAGDDLDARDAIIDLHDRDTAPNTPPTPHSRLESPVPALPPLPAGTDLQAQAARRQQSDQASAFLAQKMLQGWTLLGEECSNDTCYSVPLMRRPPFKQSQPAADNEGNGESSSKVIKIADPRRHCVICQRDYVREADVKAYEDFNQAVSGSAPSTSRLPQSQSTSKRMEQEGEGSYPHAAAAKKRRFTTQPPTSTFNVAKIMSAGTNNSGNHGKSRNLTTTQPTSFKQSSQPAPSMPVSATTATDILSNTGTSGVQGARSLQPAIGSLEKAVLRLSQHVDMLCEDALISDPAKIAESAEALARVCKSLKEVQSL